MRPPAHRFGDLEAQGEGAERTCRWTCSCTEVGPWTTKATAYEGVADHFMEHLPRMLLDRRVPPCPICCPGQGDVPVMGYLREVDHWRREMGWRWRDMCLCRCCHRIGLRHGWMKWGGRVPLPVCTWCKYVGCERCR